MANVSLREDVALDEPVLVEGLPGVGLVGKIATDHLVDTFDMTYFASVDCEGIPQVAIYGEDDHQVRPPVRLYADPGRDLVALQSDIPISRSAASEFADCVTAWVESVNATPLYLSGLPVEDQDPGKIPATYGVATGTAEGLLGEADVDTPAEAGVVGGPTGALLNRASEGGLDAVGLIVQSDPNFPDPAAARQLIVKGIEPIEGVELSTEELVERAEEIRDQKQNLAQRMGQADEDESSQAKPLRMYQ